nr:MAG TPA: hypothetical protein [Caudoviricetes sp.]DAN57605.1 MAG TPA: hypothetical protein [Bacteriophage sp.]
MVTNGNQIINNNGKFIMCLPANWQGIILNSQIYYSLYIKSYNN